MENKKEKKTCVVCQANSDEKPILVFEFKEKTYHICTQHIPVLIHNAEELQSILPGIQQ